MLPQSNATLLSVREAKGTADWDTPDGAGPVKFEGHAPAYYTEKRSLSTGAGAAGQFGSRDLELRRSLIVDPKYPRIQFEEDDVIEFMYRGIKRSGKVQIAEERDMPGAPVYGSIRLTLQTA